MTTFGAMIDRIVDECGVARTDLEAQVKRAILEAIDLHKDENFWFLQQSDDDAVVTSSTASGVAYYDWPSTLEVLHTLRILDTGQDPREMVRRHWSTLDHWASQATNYTGTPGDFAVRDDEVRLYPTPDGVFTLYWSGVFSPSVALTSDSADSVTNDWMTHGEGLIRNAAKSVLYADVLQDNDGYARSMARAQQWLQTLKGRSRKKTGTGRLRGSGL